MTNYFEDYGVKKILIIRLSSLGDILLSTPLVRTIKSKYPDAAIDFLLRKEYGDVYRCNPHLNKLYLYNNDNTGELIKELELNSYDLVIDLQNNLRSRKITEKLNTRVTRFRKKTIDKFLLVHFKINRLKNAPQIADRYAESIPGFSLDNEGLEIFTDCKEQDHLILPENSIGFCPGSRHFTKMYPEKYFIDLGNILTEKGFRIILLGGKSDIDICSRISSAINNSINLCSNNNLLLTVNYMKQCKCIVCNDSGLMHLGCAAKVPVITIFGSSVKEFGFTPYTSVKSLILENNSLSCRPCSHIGRSECPLKHFKCMIEITPEKVSESIEQLHII